jgi:uncharacterized protein YgiM (DUF1202 family)
LNLPQKKMVEDDITDLEYKEAPAGLTVENINNGAGVIGFDVTTEDGREVTVMAVRNLLAITINEVTGIEVSANQVRFDWDSASGIMAVQYEQDGVWHDALGINVQTLIDNNDGNRLVLTASMLAAEGVLVTADGTIVESSGTGSEEQNQAEEAETAPIQQVTVSGSSGARVRQTPDTGDDENVVSVPNGTTLTVIEEVTDGESVTISGETSSVWYLVRLEDGREGYVSELLVSDPIAVATEEEAVVTNEEPEVSRPETPDTNATGNETPEPVTATEAPATEITLIVEGEEQQFAVTATPPERITSLAQVKEGDLAQAGWENLDVALAARGLSLAADENDNCYVIVDSGHAAALRYENENTVVAFDGTRLLFRFAKNSEAPVEAPVETVTINGETYNVVPVPEAETSNTQATNTTLEGWNEAQQLINQELILADVEGNLFWPIRINNRIVAVAPVFITESATGSRELFAFGLDRSRINILRMGGENASEGAFATIENGNYTFQDLVDMGLDSRTISSEADNGQNPNVEFVSVDSWQVESSSRNIPYIRVQDGNESLMIFSYQESHEFIVIYVDSNGNEIRRDDHVTADDIEGMRLIVPIRYTDVNSENLTNADNRADGFPSRMVSVLIVVQPE